MTQAAQGAMLALCPLRRGGRTLMAATLETGTRVQQNAHLQSAPLLLARLLCMGPAAAECQRQDLIDQN